MKNNNSVHHTYMQYQVNYFAQVSSSLDENQKKNLYYIPLINKNIKLIKK